MKLKLATIALSVIALYSCKKSSEDPTPSDQGGSNYRVTKVDEASTDKHDVWTYTYNADDMLQEVVRTDINDAQTYKSTFQYNAKGFVSFSTQQGVSYQGSTSHTYTSDDLMDTKISYSDLAGTVPTVTTVYHYYLNKNLKYAIETQSFDGNASVDSIVYTNYTNGRPGIKRRFYKLNGEYVLQSKQLFTCDARMNLIKRQATVSSSDSTVFVDYATGTFTDLGNQQTAVWKAIDFATNSYIYNDNNPSPGSADYDADYKSEETNSSSCGMNSKYTYSIVEKNAAGYPLKVQSIQESYNCGASQGSFTVNTTITYEQY